MKKWILILLLISVLFVSCAYEYDWKGLYCTVDGWCGWMAGRRSETCPESYNYRLVPHLPIGATLFLVEDTCLIFD